MTTAHYDPLLKQTIRDRVFALLYTPADNQMFDRLKLIIERNSAKVNATHLSFMYMAVNYSCDVNRVLPRPRNQLHDSLVPKMKEYLTDMDRLVKEKPVVKAYLTRMLNTSDHPADWNRLLIQALHGPVRDLLAEQPFTNPRIDDATVDAFLKDNADVISTMKQRMVTNLLTS